jgi:hypothetical protein
MHPWLERFAYSRQQSSQESNLKDFQGKQTLYVNNHNAIESISGGKIQVSKPVL